MTEFGHEAAGPEEVPLRWLGIVGHLLGLEKPAGRLCHGRSGLLGQARRELGRPIELLHRLDRETSGVLLFADDPSAAREARGLWREQFRKRYVAIVLGGDWDAGEGTLDVPILEHHSDRPHLLARALRAAYGPEVAKRLMSGETLAGIPPIPVPARSLVHPAGRPASTRWSRLAARGALALVSLEPAQGRMHQLRLHVGAAGGEILGDRIYGRRPAIAGSEIDGALLGSGPIVVRLALHLESIERRTAEGARVARWEAPLPEEWSPLLRWLGAESE
jgi:23S rRNA-/tRNA-specific pseudouridylate synthase